MWLDKREGSFFIAALRGSGEVVVRNVLSMGLVGGRIGERAA